MTTSKYPDITVQLSGADGSAFAVMASVSKALRRAGVSDADVELYCQTSMAGDYDHLLRTAMAWVSVT